MFSLLKNEIIALDKECEEIDEHLVKVQIDLKTLYEQEEEVSTEFSDVQLAHMVAINDLKRVQLIKSGKSKEAEVVANQNYEAEKGKRKNKTPKNNCSAEICIIYPCDERNEWGEEFQCYKGCSVHLRCEGKIMEKDFLEENYKCERCETGVGNRAWLEEKICAKKSELAKSVDKLKAKHNSISMEIEQLEEEESKIGPRQRKLKESCKQLNLNPACYHGGDFEGKAIQTMLDCARGNSKFELLDCLEDLPERREKYARALSTLAKVSDALKTDFNDDFDEEDVAAIKGWCEEWGKNWQQDFDKNLTPKAHDLIFVIPEFIKQHKTFSIFYKAEQAGESIHAIFNEINRKIWSIREDEQKLWKFIERFECRNILDISIVRPERRDFRKGG